MTREDVLALVGDNGLTVYSATSRSGAIDSLAERVMEDGNRALAFDLLAGMLEDGSIVLESAGSGFKFIKGQP